MRIIRDEGLREAFSWKTDGDLYLYVYQRRRDPSPTRGQLDFRRAALAVKASATFSPTDHPARRCMRSSVDERSAGAIPGRVISRAGDWR